MGGLTIAYILGKLALFIGAYLIALAVTTVCFIEAAKLFKSKCGPGLGGILCDWWEYPFVPVFGYCIVTLIAMLVVVFVAKDCIEDILEALRSAGAINF